MSLLLPLGLLGLLGLLALLLIYILKPNYQQKIISSTFVWKLSLKYKKRALPISKFRNLLILLCQIIVICACSMILAMPVIAEAAEPVRREEVLILDSSANMYTAYEGETRFERAVSRLRTQAEDVFADDGFVTVIVADGDAHYLLSQRLEAESRDALSDALDELVCAYGTADVEGAMELAEEVLQRSPAADVLFYTATDYVDEGKEVILQDVSVEGEWNAAILGASAVLVDNYYTITVDVACYGEDEDFDLYCEVNGVNGTDGDIQLPPATVYCVGDQTYQVVYTVSEANFGENVTPVYLTENEAVWSFDRIYLRIGGGDCLSFDDEYYIYGGNKPTIAIEYYSTVPNVYMSGILLTLAADFSEDWNITIKEINGKTGGEPLTQGFDLYIFEHEVPEIMPTDGVVLLLDPDISGDAGFTLGRTITLQGSDYTGDGVALTQGVEHPIMNGVVASGIAVTQYREVHESSLDGYDVLMYFQGNPVFFAKNEIDRKIAVMAFSLNNSTLAITLYFPIIMYNMFNYYFPSTVSGNAYSVYDSVTLNARGTNLRLTDTDGEETVFLETPASYTFRDVGTYTVRQDLISGVTEVSELYVTIPREESNILRTEDELSPVVRPPQDEISFDDLMIWFAAVAFGLLLVEWLLQWRKGV